MTVKSFKVIDKQTGCTLSDVEEFFLDKNIDLYIKDVTKDGTVKINKVNPDLYDVILEIE